MINNSFKHNYTRTNDYLQRESRQVYDFINTKDIRGTSPLSYYQKLQAKVHRARERSETKQSSYKPSKIKLIKHNPKHHKIAYSERDKLNYIKSVSQKKKKRTKTDDLYNNPINKFYHPTLHIANYKEISKKKKKHYYNKKDMRFDVKEINNKNNFNRVYYHKKDQRFNVKDINKSKSRKVKSSRSCNYKRPSKLPFQEIKRVVMYNKGKKIPENFIHRSTSQKPFRKATKITRLKNILKKEAHNMDKTEKLILRNFN